MRPFYWKQPDWTIEAGKKQYYNALEQAQRSNEITPWIEYFVNICLDAQTGAEKQIEFTLRKAKFFDSLNTHLKIEVFTALASAQKMKNRDNPDTTTHNFILEKGSENKENAKTKNETCPYRDCRPGQYRFNLYFTLLPR